MAQTKCKNDGKFHFVVGCSQKYIFFMYKMKCSFVNEWINENVKWKCECESMAAKWKKKKDSKKQYVEVKHIACNVNGFRYLCEKRLFHTKIVPGHMDTEPRPQCYRHSNVCVSFFNQFKVFVQRDNWWIFHFGHMRQFIEPPKRYMC